MIHVYIEIKVMHIWYMCMYIIVSIYKYIYFNIIISLHKCKLICKCIPSIHIHKYQNVRVYIYIYVYQYIYIYICHYILIPIYICNHVYIYIPIHVYIYTFIIALVIPLSSVRLQTSICSASMLQSSSWLPLEHPTCAGHGSGWWWWWWCGGTISGPFGGFVSHGGSTSHHGCQY
jgi:hypothetical protein